MIICAGIIVFTTIFGICVASKQSKCLLGIYFTLMLILLIGAVIGTILAFTTYLDKLHDMIDTELANQGQKGKDVAEKMTEFVNHVRNLGVPVAIFIITAIVSNRKIQFIF